MNNRDVAASSTKSPTCSNFRTPTRFACAPIATRRGGSTICPSRWRTIAADPNRELTDIEGIGKDLAQKIDELLDTGSIAMLEAAASGNSRRRAGDGSHSRHGPEEGGRPLQGARHHVARRAPCRLRSRPGRRRSKASARKRRRKSWPASTSAASAHERMYWAHADEIVQELLAHMRQVKGIRQIEVAGSYRRGRETIGDIDLLVDADDRERRDGPARPVRGIGHRASAAAIRRCRSASAAACRSIFASCRRKSFGAALQYFTGSKDHNVVLRGMAKDRGLRINEYGVFRAGRDQPRNARQPPALPGVPADDDDDADLSQTPTRPTTSPAAPKKKSTRRWTCPGSRRRFAKPGRSSPGPPPASCRS